MSKLFGNGNMSPCLFVSGMCALLLARVNFFRYVCVEQPLVLACVFLFVSGMCAWNNHYCWPGTCGESFTENCQCASGFKKNAELYETTCQCKHALDVFSQIRKQV